MPLDVFQASYSLAMVANAAVLVAGTQETIQAAFQETVLAELLNTGAGWELAWGPVIWKVNPDDADTGPENAWFVARHRSLKFENGSEYPTYVVAIAGTPPLSAYAWREENFGVHTVCDFNAWVAGGIENKPVDVPRKDVEKGVPYIAKGTVNAVRVLLTTPSPPPAAAPGTSLVEFFASVDTSTSPSPKFIFAGHSLAGALSPSLALSLVRANVLPADDTLAYPLAGASPGNGDFSRLFAQTLPEKREGPEVYQVWNVNLVISLDIVSQAWSVSRKHSPEQNLWNIPTIFGKPTVKEVRFFVAVAVHTANQSGVTYHPIPSLIMKGTDANPPPTNIFEFLVRAITQHIVPFSEIMGVGIPASLKLIPGIRRKTQAELFFNNPVTAQLEWGREHPVEAKEEYEKVMHSVGDSLEED